jgi:uncharacterized repeat protein (TIGR02543 family)
MGDPTYVEGEESVAVPAVFSVGESVTVENGAFTVGVLDAGVPQTFTFTLDGVADAQSAAELIAGLYLGVKHGGQSTYVYNVVSSVAVAPQGGDEGGFGTLAVYPTAPGYTDQLTMGNLVIESTVYQDTFNLETGTSITLAQFISYGNKAFDGVIYAIPKPPIDGHLKLSSSITVGAGFVVDQDELNNNKLWINNGIEDVLTDCIFIKMPYQDNLQNPGNKQDIMQTVRLTYTFDAGVTPSGEEYTYNVYAFAANFPEGADETNALNLQIAKVVQTVDGVQVEVDGPRSSAPQSVTIVAVAKDEYTAVKSVDSANLVVNGVKQNDGITAGGLLPRTYVAAYNSVHAGELGRVADTFEVTYAIKVDGTSSDTSGRIYQSAVTVHDTLTYPDLSTPEKGNPLKPSGVSVYYKTKVANNDVINPIAADITIENGQTAFSFDVPESQLKYIDGENAGKYKPYDGGTYYVTATFSADAYTYMQDTSSGGLTASVTDPKHPQTISNSAYVEHVPVTDTSEVPKPVNDMGDSTADVDFNIAFESLEARFPYIAVNKQIQVGSSADDGVDNYNKEWAVKYSDADDTVEPDENGIDDDYSLEFTLTQLVPKKELESHVAEADYDLGTPVKLTVPVGADATTAMFEKVHQGYYILEETVGISAAFDKSVHYVHVVMPADGSSAQVWIADSFENLTKESDDDRTLLEFVQPGNAAYDLATVDVLNTSDKVSRVVIDVAKQVPNLFTENEFEPVFLKGTSEDETKNALGKLTVNLTDTDGNIKYQGEINAWNGTVTFDNVKTGTYYLTGTGITGYTQYKGLDSGTFTSGILNENVEISVAAIADTTATIDLMSAKGSFIFGNRFDGLGEGDTATDVRVKNYEITFGMYKVLEAGDDDFGTDEDGIADSATYTFVIANKYPDKEGLDASYLDQVAKSGDVLFDPGTYVIRETAITVNGNSNEIEYQKYTGNDVRVEVKAGYYGATVKDITDVDTNDDDIDDKKYNVISKDGRIINSTSYGELSVVSLNNEGVAGEFPAGIEAWFRLAKPEGETQNNYEQFDGVYDDDHDEHIGTHAYTKLVVGGTYDIKWVKTGAADQAWQLLTAETVQVAVESKEPSKPSVNFQTAAFKTAYPPKIVFNKENGLTHTALGGATFALYREVTVEIDNPDTEVGGKISVTRYQYVGSDTSPDGTVTFLGSVNGGWILPGKYYAFEIAAPGGYVEADAAVAAELAGKVTNNVDYVITDATLGKAKLTFEAKLTDYSVDDNDQKTVAVTGTNPVPNYPVYKLELAARDSSSGAPLPGVTLKVLKREKHVDENKVVEWVNVGDAETVESVDNGFAIPLTLEPGYQYEISMGATPNTYSANPYDKVIITIGEHGELSWEPGDGLDNANSYGAVLITGGAGNNIGYSPTGDRDEDETVDDNGAHFTDWYWLKANIHDSYFEGLEFDYKNSTFQVTLAAAQNPSFEINKRGQTEETDDSGKAIDTELANADFAIFFKAEDGKYYIAYPTVEGTVYTWEFKQVADFNDHSDDDIRNAIIAAAGGVSNLAASKLTLRSNIYGEIFGGEAKNITRDDKVYYEKQIPLNNFPYYGVVAEYGDVHIKVIELTLPPVPGEEGSTAAAYKFEKAWELSFDPIQVNVPNWEGKLVGDLDESVKHLSVQWSRNGGSTPYTGGDNLRILNRLEPHYIMLEKVGYEVMSDAKTSALRMKKYASLYASSAPSANAANIFLNANPLSAATVQVPSGYATIFDYFFAEDGVAAESKDYFFYDEIMALRAVQRDDYDTDDARNTAIAAAKAEYYAQVHAFWIAVNKGTYSAAGVTPKTVTYTFTAADVLPNVNGAPVSYLGVEKEFKLPTTIEGRGQLLTSNPLVRDLENGQFVVYAFRDVAHYAADGKTVVGGADKDQQDGTEVINDADIQFILAHKDEMVLIPEKQAEVDALMAELAPLVAKLDKTPEDLTKITTLTKLIEQKRQAWGANELRFKPISEMGAGQSKNSDKPNAVNNTSFSRQVPNGKYWVVEAKKPLYMQSTSLYYVGTRADENNSTELSYDEGREPTAFVGPRQWVVFDCTDLPDEGGDYDEVTKRQIGDSDSFITEPPAGGGGSIAVTFSYVRILADKVGFTMDVPAADTDATIEKRANAFLPGAQFKLYAAYTDPTTGALMPFGDPIDTMISGSYSSAETQEKIPGRFATSYILLEQAFKDAMFQKGEVPIYKAKITNKAAIELVPTTPPVYGDYILVGMRELLLDGSALGTNSEFASDVYDAQMFTLIGAEYSVNAPRAYSEALPKEIKDAIDQSVADAQPEAKDAAIAAQTAADLAQTAYLFAEADWLADADYETITNTIEPLRLALAEAKAALDVAVAALAKDSENEELQNAFTVAQTAFGVAESAFNEAQTDAIGANTNYATYVDKKALALSTAATAATSGYAAYSWLDNPTYKIYPNLFMEKIRSVLPQFNNAGSKFGFQLVMIETTAPSGYVAGKSFPLRLPELEGVGGTISKYRYTDARYTLSSAQVLALYPHAKVDEYGNTWVPNELGQLEGYYTYTEETNGGYNLVDGKYVPALLPDKGTYKREYVEGYYDDLENYTQVTADGEELIVTPAVGTEDEIESYTPAVTRDTLKSSDFVSADGLPMFYSADAADKGNVEGYNAKGFTDAKGSIYYRDPLPADSATMLHLQPEGYAPNLTNYSPEKSGNGAIENIKGKGKLEIGSEDTDATATVKKPKGAVYELYRATVQNPTPEQLELIEPLIDLRSDVTDKYPGFTSTTEALGKFIDLLPGYYYLREIVAPLDVNTTAAEQTAQAELEEARSALALAETAFAPYAVYTEKRAAFTKATAVLAAAELALESAETALENAETALEDAETALLDDTGNEVLQQAVAAAEAAVTQATLAVTQADSAVSQATTAHAAAEQEYDDAKQTIDIDDATIVSLQSTLIGARANFITKSNAAKFNNAFGEQVNYNTYGTYTITNVKAATSAAIPFGGFGATELGSFIGPIIVPDTDKTGVTKVQVDVTVDNVIRPTLTVVDFWNGASDTSVNLYATWELTQLTGEDGKEKVLKTAPTDAKKSASDYMVNATTYAANGTTGGYPTVNTAIGYVPNSSALQLPYLEDGTYKLELTAISDPREYTANRNAGGGNFITFTVSQGKISAIAAGTGGTGYAVIATQNKAVPDNIWYNTIGEGKNNVVVYVNHPHKGSLVINKGLWDSLGVPSNPSATPAPTATPTPIPAEAEFELQVFATPTPAAPAEPTEEPDVEPTPFVPSESDLENADNWKLYSRDNVGTTEGSLDIKNGVVKWSGKVSATTNTVTKTPTQILLDEGYYRIKETKFNVSGYAVENTYEGGWVYFKITSDGIIYLRNAYNFPNRDKYTDGAGTAATPLTYISKNANGDDILNPSNIETNRFRNPSTMGQIELYKISALTSATSYAGVNTTTSENATSYFKVYKDNPDTTEGAVPLTDVTFTRRGQSDADGLQARLAVANIGELASTATYPNPRASSGWVTVNATTKVVTANTQVNYYYESSALLPGTYYIKEFQTTTALAALPLHTFKVEVEAARVPTAPKAAVENAFGLRENNTFGVLSSATGATKYDKDINHLLNPVHDAPNVPATMNQNALIILNPANQPINVYKTTTYPAILAANNTQIKAEQKTAVAGVAFRLYREVTKTEILARQTNLDGGTFFNTNRGTGNAPDIEKNGVYWKYLGVKTTSGITGTTPSLATFTTPNGSMVDGETTNGVTLPEGNYKVIELEGADTLSIKTPYTLDRFADAPVITLTYRELNESTANTLYGSFSPNGWDKTTVDVPSGHLTSADDINKVVGGDFNPLASLTQIDVDGAKQNNAYTNSAMYRNLLKIEDPFIGFRIVAVKYDYDSGYNGKETLETINADDPNHLHRGYVINADGTYDAPAKTGATRLTGDMTFELHPNKKVNGVDTPDMDTFVTGVTSTGAAVISTAATAATANKVTKLPTDGYAAFLPLNTTIGAIPAEGYKFWVVETVPPSGYILDPTYSPTKKLVTVKASDLLNANDGNGAKANFFKTFTVEFFDKKAAAPSLTLGKTSTTTEVAALNESGATVTYTLEPGGTSGYANKLKSYTLTDSGLMFFDAGTSGNDAHYGNETVSQGTSKELSEATTKPSPYPTYHFTQITIGGATYSEIRDSEETRKYKEGELEAGTTANAGTVATRDTVWVRVKLDGELYDGDDEWIELQTSGLTLPITTNAQAFTIEYATGDEPMGATDPILVGEKFKPGEVTATAVIDQFPGNADLAEVRRIQNKATLTAFFTPTTATTATYTPTTNPTIPNATSGIKAWNITAPTVARPQISINKVLYDPSENNAKKDEIGGQSDPMLKPGHSYYFEVTLTTDKDLKNPVIIDLLRESDFTLDAAGTNSATGGWKLVRFEDTTDETGLAAIAVTATKLDNHSIMWSFTQPLHAGKTIVLRFDVKTVLFATTSKMQNDIYATSNDALYPAYGNASGAGFTVKPKALPTDPDNAIVYVNDGDEYSKLLGFDDVRNTLTYFRDSNKLGMFAKKTAEYESYHDEQMAEIKSISKDGVNWTSDRAPLEITQADNVWYRLQVRNNNSLGAQNFFSGLVISDKLPYLNDSAVAYSNLRKTEWGEDITGKGGVWVPDPNSEDSKAKVYIPAKGGVWKFDSDYNADGFTNGFRVTLQSGSTVTTLEPGTHYTITWTDDVSKVTNTGTITDGLASPVGTGMRAFSITLHSKPSLLRALPAFTLQPQEFVTIDYRMKPLNSDGDLRGDGTNPDLLSQAANLVAYSDFARFAQRNGADSVLKTDTNLVAIKLMPEMTKITGKVWEDAVGDGKKTDADTAILDLLSTPLDLEGITVRLYSTTDDGTTNKLVDTVLTKADGSYAFLGEYDAVKDVYAGLTPSYNNNLQYRVEFVNPDGTNYKFTDPHPYTGSDKTLAAVYGDGKLFNDVYANGTTGASDATGWFDAKDWYGPDSGTIVNAGLEVLTSISGKVWFDKINDGWSTGDKWQDNGVSDVDGLAGGNVKVKLYRQNPITEDWEASVIHPAAKTVAADGSYSFAGLDAGQYKVVFDSSSLTSPTASYGWTTFNNTAANGSDASFTDKATAYTGEVDTNDKFSTLAVATVTLAYGAYNVTDADAGIIAVKNTISGTVFEDKNYDGTINNGEVGIDGVTVTLQTLNTDGVTWNFVESKLTTSGGVYTFDGTTHNGLDKTKTYRVVFGDAASDKTYLYSKLDGDYSVSATHLNDKITVRDSDTESVSYKGGATAGFTIDEASGAKVGIDGALWLPSAITGLVWNDADGNGLQDDGTNPASFALVKVKLTYADGSAVYGHPNAVNVSAVAGKIGEYSFGGLRSGDYKVEFDKTALQAATSQVRYKWSPYTTTIEGEVTRTDSDVHGAGGNNLAQTADTLGKVNETTINGANVAVEYGETNSGNADAGITAVSHNISGTVFEDKDYDGVFDSTTGEGGVATRVALEKWIDNAWEEIAFVNSADGSYSFNGGTGLPFGSGDYYRVVFTEPAGMVFTFENGWETATGGARSDKVVGPAGNGNSYATAATALYGVLTNAITATNADEYGNVVGINAAVYTPSTISGVVWNDTTKNDVRDSTEAKFAGVTVTLHKVGSDFTEPPTTKTGENGEYTFGGLRSGNYTVEFDKAKLDESDKRTYAWSLPGVGDEAEDSDALYEPNTNLASTATTAEITVGYKDTNVGNADAGIHETNNSISGTVFNDKDYNGTINNGEAGIVGITVTLQVLNADEVTWDFVESKLTTTGGAYLFDGTTHNGLDKTKTYRVVFGDTATDTETEIETTYLYSKLDGGYSTGATHLNDKIVEDDNVRGATGSLTNFNAYGNITGIDGALWLPSSITGKVWNDADANHNGLQDAGETGFEGVTVTLYDSSNTQVDTTVTLNDGEYSFGGLRTGKYKVVFDKSDVNSSTGTYRWTLKDVGIDDTVDSDVGYTVNYAPTAEIELILDATSDYGITIEHRSDAGLYLRANSITGLVWEDENYDGVKDTVETHVFANETEKVQVEYHAAPPIEPFGAFFRLVRTTVPAPTDGWVPFGEPVDTDENGRFFFDNAGAGIDFDTYIYRIKVINPDTDTYKFSATGAETIVTLDRDTIHYVDVNEDKDALDDFGTSGVLPKPSAATGELGSVDAGLYSFSTITGVVWYENGESNGLKDDGETFTDSFGDVVAYLYGVDGDETTLLDKVIVNADGTYTFEGLKDTTSGDYKGYVVEFGMDGDEDLEAKPLDERFRDFEWVEPGLGKDGDINSDALFDDGIADNGDDSQRKWAHTDTLTIGNGETNVHTSDAGIKWSYKDFTLIFDENDDYASFAEKAEWNDDTHGYTDDGQPWKTVTYNSAAGGLPTDQNGVAPTRSGYRFVGWSVQSGNSNSEDFLTGTIISLAAIPLENFDFTAGTVKVYAVWQANNVDFPTTSSAPASETPDPSETPAPSETPVDESATPEPRTTPEPSTEVTAEPSATPDASATPETSNAPETSEEPKPSTTPVPNDPSHIIEPTEEETVFVEVEIDFFDERAVLGEWRWNPESEEWEYVEIDEDGIALGAWVYNEERKVWSFVPPRTGDAGMTLWAVLAGTAGLAALVVAKSRKRKED